MSAYCKSGQENCFADLPLHTVLSEWLRRNIPLATCTETLLIQIGVFLLTYYTVKFALKIFFNLAWPVIILACGYVAFQMLRMSGHQLPETFLLYLDEFYYWAISTGQRILVYLCRKTAPLFEPAPF